MFAAIVVYVQNATGLEPEYIGDQVALFPTYALKNKRLEIRVDHGQLIASLYVPEENIAGLHIEEEQQCLVVQLPNGTHNCVKMSSVAKLGSHVFFRVELDSVRHRWGMEATLALLVDALMRD